MSNQIDIAILKRDPETFIENNIHIFNDIQKLKQNSINILQYIVKKLNLYDPEDDLSKDECVYMIYGFTILNKLELEKKSIIKISKMIKIINQISYDPTYYKMILSKNFNDKNKLYQYLSNKLGDQVYEFQLYFIELFLPHFSFLIEKIKSFCTHYGLYDIHSIFPMNQLKWIYSSGMSNVYKAKNMIVKCYYDNLLINNETKLISQEFELQKELYEKGLNVAKTIHINYKTDMFIIYSMELFKLSFDKYIYYMKNKNLKFTNGHLANIMIAIIPIIQYLHTKKSTFYTDFSEFNLCLSDTKNESPIYMIDFGATCNKNVNKKCSISSKHCDSLKLLEYRLLGDEDKIFSNEHGLYNYFDLESVGNLISYFYLFVNEDIDFPIDKTLSFFNSLMSKQNITRNDFDHNPHIKAKISYIEKAISKNNFIKSYFDLINQYQSNSLPLTIYNDIIILCTNVTKNKKYTLHDFYL